MHDKRALAAADAVLTLSGHRYQQVRGTSVLLTALDLLHETSVHEAC